MKKPPASPHGQHERSVEILLVEDNLGDVRLTKEALRDGRIETNLHVVNDGVEALAFLRRESPYAGSPRPDLILLDLNMPRMDGREVLSTIKEDSDFKRIPVIVLTSSAAEEDILRAYELSVNCYITKPVEFDKFVDAIKTLEDFWLKLVKLPQC